MRAAQNFLSTNHYCIDRRRCQFGFSDSDSYGAAIDSDGGHPFHPSSEVRGASSTERVQDPLLGITLFRQYSERKLERVHREIRTYRV